MVAYNFKERFAEKIRDGSKCQTVRGQRDRHARPGEPLQLYTEQRTKQCEKLITPDPICLSVEEIQITINNDLVVISGWILPPNKQEGFAIADGFESYAEFLAFFAETHGFNFEGVLIKWKPQLDHRVEVQL